MEIKSVKYNLIRKSIFDVEHDDFNNGIDSYLSNFEAINLSKVNICIGQNGSGKSTLIDIIRSLKQPEILRTLPRDNPKAHCTPGYSIELSSGTSIIAMFHTATFDSNIKGFDVVGFRLIKKDSSGNKLLYQGDLRKFDANPLIERAVSSAVKSDEIHYKYSGDLDNIHDESFVRELEYINHNLEGIKGSDGESKSHQSFYLEEGGKVQVYFSDDPTMDNRMDANYFPSGWKAYADITSWMMRLPNNSICLIEEPEVHLHPNLQRLLIKRILEISEEKEMQLVITTHSNIIMNCDWGEGSKLFNVQDGKFRELNDAADIIERLGYKPSDILQTNCMIWVEGPSDRIYVNKWIRAKAPHLVEGVNYSIMFFGGKLYTYLLGANDSPEEQLMQDFIELIRINRKFVVIMDSDKSSIDSKIYERKTTLLKNVENNGGICWITEGREIENYCNFEELSKSISRVNSNAVLSSKGSKWENFLAYTTPSSDKKKIANKVKVAKDYMSSNLDDFSNYDLEKRIDELVAYIEGSN